MQSLIMKNKGQILIFVFILLILTGILVAGISNLWDSGLQLNRGQIESLIAYYMAQSGLERAEADIIAAGVIANNYHCNGTFPNMGEYSVTVVDVSGSGPKRHKVTSVGRCGNSERVMSFSFPTNPPNYHGVAKGFWRHFEDTWTEE